MRPCLAMLSRGTQPWGLTWQHWGHQHRDRASSTAFSTVYPGLWDSEGQATRPAGTGVMLPLPTPHPGSRCLSRASPAPPAAPTGTGAHGSLQLSLTREMSLRAGNSSVEPCTAPGLRLFLQTSGNKQFQKQSGHPDPIARLGFHQLGEWDTVGTWQECCPWAWHSPPSLVPPHRDLLVPGPCTSKVSCPSCPAGCHLHTQGWLMERVSQQSQPAQHLALLSQHLGGSKGTHRDQGLLGVRHQGCDRDVGGTSTQGT